MVLHVDDVLFTANIWCILYNTKDFISKNFEMKDIGETSCVIGITIFRDRLQQLLELPQKSYIKRVLERFNMNKCSIVIAPMQKGDKFSLIQYLKNDMEHNIGNKVILVSTIWKLQRKFYMLIYKKFNQLEVVGYSNWTLSDVLTVESLCVVICSC